MRLPDDHAVARLLVAGQAVLLVLLLVVPGRGGWPVPGVLAALSGVVAAVGVGIVLVAGTTLGRGLTATPLPNARAQLRTTGLYRFVRHPIYSGVLLAAAAFTVGTGSVTRLALLLLLVLQIFALQQGHALLERLQRALRLPCAVFRGGQQRLQLRVQGAQPGCEFP